MNTKLRNIQFQLMWNRLISVVEEEAQTLIRTAFGTSTREAGDLSAGVYDTAGSMLAQAVTGTPGHVNSMAKTVGHVLRKFPLETMAPGDSYITNDPWLGTGHLSDVVVVTPCFRGEIPVAFFACTLHVVDIGGLGGGGGARQVYEEGLTLPIIKLVDRGRINEGLIDLIRANVREEVQVVGDIYSEITANEAGCRRLLAMMAEFGIERLDELAAHILERSREASLEAIRMLPFGIYSSSMTTDGVEGPISLNATVAIGPDGIDVNFPDCPGLTSLGFNVPLCYTEAYTCFGVKCAVAPQVPNNAGSLATIRVRAPEGSILNAPHPAPVQSRAVLGQLLPDLIFGCLEQAIPRRVLAEGASRLWSLRLTGGRGRVEASAEILRDATPFTVVCFHAGGMGARPMQDGLSATAFPSGVRNVPVEITEMNSAVLFWRKEFRSDSGGAGEQRGGLGQILEIESAEAKPFAAVTSFDRIKFPARGRKGGLAGAAGRLSFTSGKQLPGKGTHQVPSGERLLVEMPGGGGFGDPLRRDPERVAEDVRNGLVSHEAALADYGVALTLDCQVDVAATKRHRSKLAA